MKTRDDYLKMQNDYYEGQAARWSLDYKDPVVSWYDEHQSWADYDTQLFRGFDTKGKIALDYGCGPGRSMVRYKDRFERVDGVDIAAGNLEKAKVNLQAEGIPIPKLYKNNGKDLEGIPSNYYDVVFSVICLQHICSHSIRFSIMNDIYRVLRPGGYFCAQMGFGLINLTTYHDNNYDATGTNGAADVCFNDTYHLERDLLNIGYKNFSYVLRPACQDQHPQWIWFQVQK